MKRLAYILLTAFALFLLNALSASAFAAGQIGAVLQTTDGRNLTVSLLKNEKQYVLLLPSFADVKRLQINGLNGEISNSKGTVRCRDGKPVDLTKIVPDFTPGKACKVVFKDSSGKKTSVQIMQSKSLSAVFISLGTTEDGKAADREWMDADKHRRVVDAMLVKVSSGGKVQVGSTVDSIHCRGNASYLYAKRKSYTVRLNSRQSLVKKAEAEIKWVLVANDVYDENGYHDRTGICNDLSRWLYKTLNGKYALDTEFADLYIDGEYRGIYMISEKAEISDARVSVTRSKMRREDITSVTRVVGSCGLYLNGETVWKGYDQGGLHRDRMDSGAAEKKTILYSTAEEDSADPAVSAGIRAYQYSTSSIARQIGGFLLEFDFRFGDVPAWFVTRRGAAIAVKEPEYASREQVQLIAAYVQEFEDALFSKSGYNQSGKHFTEYADIDSAVRFSISEFFLANIDTFHTSTFLVIDRIDGILQRITFGPVWDNDYCLLSSAGLISNRHAFKLKSEESGYPIINWLEQLFTKTEYVSGMYKIWQEELLPAVETYTGKTLPGLVSKITPSLNMSVFVTEKLDPAKSLTKVTGGIQNRLKSWKNLWNAKNLKGVSVSRRNGRLTVRADGSYSKITWYKVSAKDFSCKKVASGKGTSFTPAESGMYFAEVTGPNLLYTKTGASGALGQKNRAMCSKVISFTAEE